MDAESRKYPEETYAKEICKRLENESFVKEFDVLLSVQGAGVHWHCVVSRIPVHAVITCFDQGAFGTQYFIEFKIEEENKAIPRVFRNEQEAIEWLNS